MLCLASKRGLQMRDIGVRRASRKDDCRASHRSGYRDCYNSPHGLAPSLPFFTAFEGHSMSFGAFLLIELRGDLQSLVSQRFLASPRSVGFPVDSAALVATWIIGLCASRKRPVPPRWQRRPQFQRLCCASRRRSPSLSKCRCQSLSSYPLASPVLAPPPDRLARGEPEYHHRELRQRIGDFPVRIADGTR
jgi:hypothetical protein